MSSARLIWVIANMQDRELASLAALYGGAVAKFGTAPLALDVLAIRLDIKSLARIATFFGSEPIYAALGRVAPKKIDSFLSALGGYWWPNPGQTLTPHGRIGAMEPNVDMSPRQIYESFRNGVNGSLSVKGALHQSISYMAPRFSLYYAGGYAFGTLVVDPLIETYAPTLWQVIGSTISSVVQPIIDAVTPTERGNAQRDLSTPMELGPIAAAIGSSGGDYGCCMEWRDWAGGGGGCGAPSTGDSATADPWTWLVEGRGGVTNWYPMPCY